MLLRSAALCVCLLVAASSVACTGMPLKRQAAFYITRTKAAVIPPVGLLYTGVKAPVAAGVSGKPFGTRVGRASVHSIAIPPNPFGVQGSGGSPAPRPEAGLR